MGMDPDKKDFLLKLYDKLWENMASKEARLWSYLSVYGAAVVLAIGAGQYAVATGLHPGVQLYAVLVVLALTLWAILIVINANWWFQRNRLMVTQIEKQFAAGDNLKGVIPGAYLDARFQIDRLYRGSVLILSSLALLFYLRTMWQFHRYDSFSSSDQIVSVGLLYALFTLSIIFCVNQHDSYITTYYMTKRDLLIEQAGGTTTPQIEDLVKNGKQLALKSYAWVGHATWVLIFVIIVFDLLPGRETFRHRCPLVVGTLLQLLTIGIYFVFTKLPRGRYSWRDAWYLRLLAAVIIFGSAAVFLMTPARTLINASGGWPSF
jgi:hypothetical protein